VAQPAHQEANLHLGELRALVRHDQVVRLAHPVLLVADARAGAEVDELASGRSSAGAAASR
jgi:hypothetical protein